MKFDKTVADLLMFLRTVFPAHEIHHVLFVRKSDKTSDLLPLKIYGYFDGNDSALYAYMFEKVHIWHFGQTSLTEEYGLDDDYADGCLTIWVDNLY